ncbi:anti-sigma factor [uncultured Ruegeria sp.]|uniref:anti-sigma factor family protein n=1 Tax=uncultured Ruegeria sp. TaxID=259304 RepID=UPI00260D276C|nr:anti-sigma factor [uncultured Ruegeria sp.]
MRIDGTMISAFIDGELSDEETSFIEDALMEDKELRVELEELSKGHQIAVQDLSEALSSPIPFELITAINNSPDSQPANSTQKPYNFSWVAAVVAALFLGLFGGSYTASLRGEVELASTPDWISDVADYHRVYSNQVRHLVEVMADEKDHLETWLTNTIGTDVNVPDLSDHGLTFQGGRLLVAAGKPVSQLIFTDVSGQVVALCLIKTDSPNANFKQHSIEDFSLVTWGGGSGNYVVIGDKDRSDLLEIAQSASRRV